MHPVLKPYGFLLTCASNKELVKLNTSTTACTRIAKKPFSNENKNKNGVAIKKKVMDLTTIVAIKDFFEGNAPFACLISFTPLKINTGVSINIDAIEPIIVISENAATNPCPSPSKFSVGPVYSKK